MSDSLQEMQHEKLDYAPPIELRRFNSTGIEQWSGFLDTVGTANPAPFPFSLLEDPAATSIVKPGTHVEQRSFRTRFELAQYLNERLDKPGYRDVQSDIGMWTWLSFFYFNLLCPADAHGQRKAGDPVRWILASSGRGYFHHLLAGPFGLYRSHKENPDLVRPLLSERVIEEGRIYRELTARGELATNPTVLEIISLLYFDDEAGYLKPGADNPDEPGSAIRLIDVLSQFQVTWDLQSLDAGTLFLILPDEFDRFR